MTASKIYVLFWRNFVKSWSVNVHGALTLTLIGCTLGPHYGNHRTFQRTVHTACDSELTRVLRQLLPLRCLTVADPDGRERVQSVCALFSN